MFVQKRIIDDNIASITALPANAVFEEGRDAPPRKGDGDGLLGAVMFEVALLNGLVVFSKKPPTGWQSLKAKSDVSMFQHVSHGDLLRRSSGDDDGPYLQSHSRCNSRARKDRYPGK